ncbi:VPEID-CTERM sorting domain-containing protein [Leisingera daeponensis]|uniref:VPEID-CTERM sorting domain-containing protein n=1 Tax=Leisingera daeponensis TaxID=405746 RepID=A0ABS7NJ95_9RHOB|nr:VPEID-CTERM sorting domain-containing protein [Leisingera daeponensis]MBY6140981.1 VPEID-CTERM sorting domain-containing protein [Leisingera daeponensis]
MKTFLTAAGAAIAANCMTLTAAFAMGNGHGHGIGNGGGNGNAGGNGWGNGVGNPHGVPEIDAGTGLLTLAAVGAALILAWEVNRRRRA